MRPIASFVRLIGRFLPLVAGVALVHLCLMPNASAAGIGGKYSVGSVTGSLKIAGQTTDISNDTVSNFGALKNGKATITHGRLLLYPANASAQIQKMLAPLGVTIKTKVSSPDYIQLRKTGDHYVGSTTAPLIVNFSGSYMGEKFSGSLRYPMSVVVKGGKLTVKTRVSGSVAGMPVSGNINLVCNK